MRKLSLNELNRVNVSTYKQQVKTDIVVILDNIRSGLNVGSFFRTTDAFGLNKIILCGITPTPPHKEISKSAIGATKSVDWEHYENIDTPINLLKEIGYQVICVEQTTDSIRLQDFDLKNKRIALVFGNEVDGVSESALSLTDYAVEIPQFGTKHSLNVSVCGGVTLWEFMKKINRL